MKERRAVNGTGESIADSSIRTRDTRNYQIT